MENQKKKAGAIITGSVLASAIVALAPSADAAATYNYTPLGSGAELRSELIQLNHTSVPGEIELKCGGKKEAKSKKGEEKAGEGKCGEGKCGEGKCGEKKVEEGKAGEAKCGEGKCGEGKAEKGKAGEAKCGEGKCGEGKCGEKKK